MMKLMIGTSANDDLSSSTDSSSPVTRSTVYLLSWFFRLNATLSGEILFSPFLYRFEVMEEAYANDEQ